MRVPKHLLPEILARHAAGQSDQSICDWLARLSPPVQVTRVGLMKARKRATPGSAAPPRVPKPPAKPAAQAAARLARPKRSGAQNRKAAAAQAAQFAAGYKGRTAFVPPIPEETDPLRGHLYDLRTLLSYQHAVNTDPVMNLPEKIRASTTIAQAMGRIQIQAEVQRKLEQAIEERTQEVADFAEDLRAIEVQKKALAAEKAEIEAEWIRIQEARAKFAADQRAAGVPVVQAVG